MEKSEGQKPKVIICKLTPVYENEKLNDEELDLVAGGGLGSRALAGGLLSLALMGSLDANIYAAKPKAASDYSVSTSSSNSVLFKSTQGKVDFSNLEEARKLEIFSEDISDTHRTDGYKKSPELKIKILEKAYEVSKDFWEYLNSKGITDFEIKKERVTNAAGTMVEGKIIFKNKGKDEPTDRYFEKELKPYIEEVKKAEDKEKVLTKAHEFLGFAKNDFITLVELFPYYFMFYCKEKNIIPYVPERFQMVNVHYNPNTIHSAYYGFTKYVLKNYDPPDELKDEYERIKKDLKENAPKNIKIDGVPVKMQNLDKLEKILKESSGKVSEQAEVSSFPINIDDRASYKKRDWEVVSKIPDVKMLLNIYQSDRQNWQNNFENNKKEFDKIFDILQRGYLEYKNFVKYLREHKTLEKEVYSSEKFEKQNYSFSEKTKHDILDERTVVQEFIDNIKALPENEKYTIENFRKMQHFCADLYSKTFHNISSTAKRCCPLEYERFCKETDTVPDINVSRMDLSPSTTLILSNFKDNDAIYKSYTTEELRELADFSFYQLGLFANEQKGVDLRSYGEKYLRDKDSSTTLDMASRVASLRDEFLKRKSTLSKDELALVYYYNMQLTN